ncbi:MAG: hypothetical protein DRP62_08060 [Planctomycetota bacterium]|nr:MAG: hypothetical protein DRP62_08060 [Planctomycetota bacterium]
MKGLKAKLLEVLPIDRLSPSVRAAVSFKPYFLLGEVYLHDEGLFFEQEVPSELIMVGGYKRYFQSLFVCLYEISGILNSQLQGSKEERKEFTNAVKTFFERELYQTAYLEVPLVTFYGFEVDHPAFVHPYAVKSGYFNLFWAPRPHKFGSGYIVRVYDWHFKAEVEEIVGTDPLVLASWAVLDLVFKTLWPDDPRAYGWAKEISKILKYDWEARNSPLWLERWLSYFCDVSVDYGEQLQKTLSGLKRGRYITEFLLPLRPLSKIRQGIRLLWDEGRSRGGPLVSTCWFCGKEFETWKRGSKYCPAEQVKNVEHGQSLCRSLAYRIKEAIIRPLLKKGIYATWKNGVLLIDGKENIPQTVMKHLNPKRKTYHHLLQYLQTQASLGWPDPEISAWVRLR